MKSIVLMVVWWSIAAGAYSQEFVPAPDPSTCQLWRPHQCSSVFNASHAIEKTKPEYPFAARKIGIEGAVRVQVTIDAAGNVVGAEFVDGPSLFEQSAVDAARQWRFQPAKLNHRAIPSMGMIVFHFLYRSRES